jgi:hypothetical protein
LLERVIRLKKEYRLISRLIIDKENRTHPKDGRQVASVTWADPLGTRRSTNPAKTERVTLDNIVEAK